MLKTSFFLISLFFIDHQNCDARRREEVQKKHDYSARSTATAFFTYTINSESHALVDDKKQEPQLRKKTNAP